MKKRLLFLLPLLFLIALFVLFTQGLKQDPHLLPSTRLSQPAPAFSLTVLGENKLLTEKIFLHHFSLLVVFASWCETCAQEQPYLFQLKKNHPTLQLIGLNYKDNPETATAWLKQQGNPFTWILQDPQGMTAIDYGVYGTPEIFLISPEGKILAKHVGALDEAIFAKEFQRYINQF